MLLFNFFVISHKALTNPPINSLINLHYLHYVIDNIIQGRYYDSIIHKLSHVQARNGHASQNAIIIIVLIYNYISQWKEGYVNVET